LLNRILNGLSEFARGGSLITIEISISFGMRGN
jgi:hypothetical protein